MERELKLIISLYVWAALVQLYIGTRFSSAALSQHVGMKIANDDYISGFISIDCGADTDYMDEQTGIPYQTDKGFIETGTNHVVSPNVDLNYNYIGRQLKTLRSFPEGKRNCYNLKPKQGKNNKYLIRALFAYGNYDSLNQAAVFDLYLGASYWTTHAPRVSPYFSKEIVHMASMDSINVCLVNIDQGTPFISALELRPLTASVYPILPAPQALLYLHKRVDVGTTNSTPTHSRYKGDIYDRLWFSYPTPNNWYKESINISDDEILENTYEVPVQVWRTAVRSFNLSYALEFDYDSAGFPPLNKSSKYYVFFHFAEIEQLPSGHKRIINITLNDESILSEPRILDYLKPFTVMNKNATHGKVHFRVSATSESDAPPILNAFEVYKLITEVSSTDAGDFEAIMDIKNTYKISRPNWQGDPCLPHEFVWEGLICDSHDSNPRIISLNLSSSQLTKEIATSFSNLTELEFLDLSNNDLVGPLPEFLAGFPKLKVLNLTGNKLSGPIPKALKEKANTTLQLRFHTLDMRGKSPLGNIDCHCTTEGNCNIISWMINNFVTFDLFFSLANNPGLCMSDSCEKQKRKSIIPLVASIPPVIAILAIFIGIWIFKQRKQVAVMDSKSKKEELLKSKNRSFSYSEVLNITENFKTIIGEGGFGKVYFGILQDHTQVAIKLLSSSSMQGYEEFRSEAQLLMIVHHRNLVSLIGYCDEGEIKALIYEYMANGNLHQHLSEKNPNVLKWNERLQIAVDAACGLDYLHNGCKPPLVHRDLKASNILINENMRAKIADFGLCKAFVNDINSHVTTRPAGTPGYIDPEFQRTGNLSKKSDLYSFGIILFELITGQPAVLRKLDEAIHILAWAIPKIDKGDIQSLVDPTLQGELNMNSVWKAVEIALSCISPTAAERPDISHILVELKESLEMVQRGNKRSSSILEMSLNFDSETAPSAR